MIVQAWTASCPNWVGWSPFLLWTFPLIQSLYAQTLYRHDNPLINPEFNCYTNLYRYWNSPFPLKSYYFSHQLLEFTLRITRTNLILKCQVVLSFIVSPNQLNSRIVLHQSPLTSWLRFRFYLDQTIMKGSRCTVQELNSRVRKAMKIS